jgi:hypothetical protein
MRRARRIFMMGLETEQFRAKRDVSATQVGRTAEFEGRNAESGAAGFKQLRNLRVTGFLSEDFERFARAVPGVAEGW